MLSSSSLSSSWQLQYNELCQSLCSLTHSHHITYCADPLIVMHKPLTTGQTILMSLHSCNIIKLKIMWYDITKTHIARANIMKKSSSFVSQANVYSIFVRLIDEVPTEVKREGKRYRSFLYFSLSTNVFYTPSSRRDGSSILPWMLLRKVTASRPSMRR